MSEAEVLKIIQSIKDKQLADLIRSHISEPTEIKLLLIMTKLGITVQSGEINTIIYNVKLWYETDDYEEPETHLQLGGIIVDGQLYVLELVYNHHEKSAKIQLKQKSSIILQLIDVGGERA
jgi:hypothetical protein